MGITTAGNQLQVGLIEYRRSVGIHEASDAGKFVLLAVAAHAGSRGMFVSPTSVTLSDPDGLSVSVHSSTYGLDPSLDTISLVSGGTTVGYVAFLVPIEFVPARVIWQGRSDDVTIDLIPPRPH